MTNARGSVESPAPDSAGTLRPTPGGYFAQFSIGGGKRKGVTLVACATEADALKRKAAIAKLVARLRATGHRAMCANLIRDCGAADDDGMRNMARLVERIATGKEPGLAKRHGVRREGVTVKELADLWTSGELAHQYPDHVKVKKTSVDDARLFKWILKVRMPDGTTFGDRAIRSVTLDDCDHVMGALPTTAEAPATRRTYAVAIRRLLVYAVYPLRLLPVLPIPKGWLPRGGGDKAKAWIYPNEDATLMACRDVPLAQRLFFGLLVREGMRVSEALAMGWPDLDLERGVVRLDVNKTDDPRSWAMGEDVTRALIAWRALLGKTAKKDSQVFPRSLGNRRLARALRIALERANVKRPELTVAKPGRMILRAHDLRGSFVTLALAAGRTEAWVTDRTGHRSSTMIYRYKRAARTAAELGLGWLAPLDEAIPEFAPAGCQDANGVQTGGPARRSGTAGDSKTSEETTPKGASGRALGALKTGDVARRPWVRIPPPPLHRRGFRGGPCRTLLVLGAPFTSHSHGIHIATRRDARTPARPRA
jgi:integrase